MVTKGKDNKIKKKKTKGYEGTKERNRMIGEEQNERIQAWC